MKKPVQIYWRPWLAAVAATALMAGCAPRADMEQVQGQQFEVRSMVASNQQAIQSLDARLRQLQDEFQELQHSQAPSSANNAELAARVSKLEAAVNAMQANAAGAVAPGAVAPGLTPPGMPPSTAGMPPEAGGIPANVPPNAGTESPGEAGDSTTAEAPPDVSSEPGMAPPAAPAPATIPDHWRTDLARELAAPVPSGGAGRAYRRGLELMRDGQYAAAIERFTLLQKKYPHSDLTEPADYFAAIGYYQSHKYEQAILQFNDLVMRYPKGRYASHALLHEAQAFLKINDKIDARLTLQKLVSEHADTPEASAANALIRNLEAD